MVNNVGKVGPAFDKLDKREYKMYTSDLSYRASYISLNKYDTSYRKLGHVETVKGINMGKMMLRKQFLEEDDPRLNVTLNDK